MTGQYLDRKRSGRERGGWDREMSASRASNSGRPKRNSHEAIGADKKHFSTAWYDSARLAFPLQFSTTLDWAGLYTWAANSWATSWKTFSFRVAPSRSRWIRSSAINKRNVCTSSSDHETDIFWLKKWCARSKQFRSFKKSCVRSFAGCADLNLVGLVSRVASSMTQVVTILSGQSVISRIYTSHFGNCTARLEPQPKWYWRKVPGTVHSEKKKESEPCSGKSPKVANYWHIFYWFATSYY